jgi:hypothetical protein
VRKHKHFRLIRGAWVLSLKINNNTLSKTFAKSASINYKHTTVAHAETSVIYALFINTALEYFNRSVEGIILWYILYFLRTETKTADVRVQRPEKQKCTKKQK